MDSGFEVTVLSRTAQAGDEHTKAVDYDSTESLTEALVGQDAVVSTLAPAAWQHHFKLLDAAINSKVKHFIPSDYTALSTFPEVADMPYWKDLASVQQYIKEKADRAGLKWTVVVAGSILDCILNGSFMYNFEEQTALVTSGGDSQVSMTRGPALGTAIAKILSRSDGLESGPIFVHEIVTTQNEMLRMAEKLTGKEWPVQHVDGEDTMQKGVGMMKASEGGKPNMFACFLVIQGSIFSGKYKSVCDGSGNKLLDLPLMSKDELESLIRTRVEGGVLYGGLPWNSAPKPRPNGNTTSD